MYMYIYIYIYIYIHKHTYIYRSFLDHLRNLVNDKLRYYY